MESTNIEDCRRFGNANPKNEKFRFANLKFSYEVLKEEINVA